VTQTTGLRARLNEVEERLQARLARAGEVERLDELFVQGRAPDPAPDGFLAGRWLVISCSGVLDLFERGLAGIHMPWLGKSFAPATSTGVNVLTRPSRIPLALLGPAHDPRRGGSSGRVEAFPFRTRVGDSACDPGVRVLEIDYDRDPNPPWARRVLDELVELDAGLYLGKMLVRGREGFRPVGYFALE
jgi:hypothetical protein